MTEIVKFADFSREYQQIKKEIDHAVQRVLESGWFILGREVAAFEREFADYHQVAGCAGVASGTEALALGLLACDVRPGDEVITVTHTAVPTATAISMVGATPRFVDCLADTCLMDVGQVEPLINERTRAIIPVHLYGQCVDMDELLDIVKHHDIQVIEDCAQATGATYKGRRAGTMGAAGCFSFYPSKNLGCYGDGGAVLSDDPGFIERIKMLRNYGQEKRYYHREMGINSRLDEIQAAILRAKLPYLDEWNRLRCQMAKRYSEALACLPVEPVHQSYQGESVYHLYVVISTHRDSLQQELTKRGIETLLHYPVPVHLQQAYRHLGYSKNSFPVAERVCGQVLSLPLYPQLADDEQEKVISALRSWQP